MWFDLTFYNFLESNNICCWHNINIGCYYDSKICLNKKKNPNKERRRKKKEKKEGKKKKIKERGQIHIEINNNQILNYVASFYNKTGFILLNRNLFYQQVDSILRFHKLSLRGFFEKLRTLREEFLSHINSFNYIDIASLLDKIISISLFIGGFDREENEVSVMIEEMELKIKNNKKLISLFPEILLFLNFEKPKRDRYLRYIDDNHNIPYL